MLVTAIKKSISFFTSRYKFISNGNLPGFDSNKRIPITIQTTYGASGKDGSVPSASVIATCSYGKSLTLASGYENDNTGGYGNLNVVFSATALIDLMKQFNFDWEQLRKIKSIDHSTTVVAWLEKMGGLRTLQQIIKLLLNFGGGAIC